MDDADNNQGDPQDQSGALVEGSQRKKTEVSGTMEQKKLQGGGAMLDKKKSGRKSAPVTVGLLELEVFTAAQARKPEGMRRADIVKARHRGEDSERKSRFVSR